MGKHDRDTFEFRTALAPAARAAVFVVSLWLTSVLYRVLSLAILSGEAAGSPEHPLQIILVAVSLAHRQKELHWLAYLGAAYFLLASFLGPKKNAWPERLWTALAVLWFLWRTADLTHLYFSGMHLQKETLDHVEWSAFRMALDPRLPLLIAPPIGLGIAIAWLGRKLALDRLGGRRAVWVGLWLAVYLAGGLQFSRLLKNQQSVGRWTAAAEAAQPSLGAIPEAFFIQSYQFSKEDELSSVAPDVLHKLKRFGIELRPGQPYPLRRERVFEEEFPYPRRPGTPNRPNIILIVLESLSARLINAHESRHPGLTPHLDSFASASTVVAPHFNGSTPTINGLLTILFSHYPVFSHKDWKTWSARTDFEVLSLQEVLRPEGYRSYSITGQDPLYARQKPLLLQNGVDEVLGIDEIRATTGQHPNCGAFFAYSDRQVFQFLAQRLREKKFTEPFTLTLNTLDLHLPFQLPADMIPAAVASPVLAVVHNTDAAFGEFWSYFRESPFANNTIIIVTADHAIQPGSEVKKISEGREVGFYDEVPLIIHDPTHLLPSRLEVPSSSVDVTPSILHLIGVNVPNPFEGHTVFGQQGRASFPGLLGSNLNHFFFRLEGKNNEAERSTVHCPPSRREDSDTFTFCDYLAWWRYKRWLVNHGRIWPSGKSKAS